jgi:hypothetical protein
VRFVQSRVRCPARTRRWPRTRIGPATVPSRASLMEIPGPMPASSRCVGGTGELSRPLVVEADPDPLLAPPQPARRTAHANAAAVALRHRRGEVPLRPAGAPTGFAGSATRPRSRR